jgi:inosine-uridine nucleoside N-ribohydrolase
MILRRILIIVATALLVSLASWGQAEKRRVIIDTNPGTDDAMDILPALNSPELKAEVFTVVPGNVDGKQGLENALKLVSLAGCCDVPVANRMGANEKNVLHGDHYEIEGYQPLQNNTRVCLSSGSERFLQFFSSRIKGK